MKLRTRIALLGGVLIFLATLLCGAAFFRLYRRQVVENAAAEGAGGLFSVQVELDRYAQAFPRGLDREQVGFFFKSRREDYCVALAGDAVWYNQTSLSPERLRRAAAGGEAGDWGLLDQDGRRLMVFHAQMRTFDLYRLYDVTEAYGALQRLALAAVGISLLAAAVLVLVLVLALRRELRPLTALSQGARAIAAGAYDRRVDARRRDEIGALGEDFNRMAEAVERHIRAVEESDEKKTLFMGGLTHELKTPLTAISGYAQTLRRVKLSPEDTDAALRYIEEESGRLDRLAKKMMRLLELDRAEDLGFEEVPVGELFAAAARTAGSFADACGVSVQVGTASGSVRGDRDLLSEALVNLLVNGIRASEPGSTVRLYAQNGDWVVEDRGRGIPEQEIPRITEPFYMVDKSRSRKNGGAGLGLALTALILRRHGFGLQFQSRVGEGTRVTVFTNP